MTASEHPNDGVRTRAISPVDLVGEKFVEAGKPPACSRKNQAPAPEAGDVGRFEEFWSNYPDRKNNPNFQYKTDAAKRNCRNAYVKLRKTWQDNAPAFDEKVLSSLESWKKSEQWINAGTGSARRFVCWSKTRLFS